MGFLSAYDGVERITIDHPDKDYWIDLKKNISQGEKEKAEREIQTYKPLDGKMVLIPDVVKAQQLLILASIHSWNLDDENGTPWVVNLVNVKRLPSTVFDTLLKRVDALTAPPSAEERRRFPADGFGGDPDGDGGASEPGDVPDGAGDLQAARADA